MDVSALALQLMQFAVANDERLQQYQPYIPDTFSEDVLVTRPDGRHVDPVFGIADNGDFKIIVPQSFDLSEPYRQMQLGHELVHYLQALQIQANNPDLSVEQLAKKLKQNNPLKEKEARLFEKRFDRLWNDWQSKNAASQ